MKNRFMLPSSPRLLDIKNKLLKDDITLHTDLPTRMLFSTDASIYQIEPLGVIYPQSTDDLTRVVQLAASYKIPLLARGSGTSLAGQSIGEAIILDCSRHLNHILEINPETRTAKVEPGVILTTLNAAAAKFRLQFGPDPSSAERATFGGSLANNATGSHSISYGMAADHLKEVNVLLADGSSVNFREMPIEEANLLAAQNFNVPENNHKRSLESNIYHTALQIREGLNTIIRSTWPDTWRRASGYNLNYLLPWSPSSPAMWYMDDESDSEHSYPPVPTGSLNLAPLIAGSEGTLGIIQQATINLVPVPRNTVLGILPFSGLKEACSAVPGLLEHNPSAIELIPQSIIRLALAVPAYAKRLKVFDRLERPYEALLVVEFSGDDFSLLLDKVKALGRDSIIASTLSEQKQIWEVRKVGLGILASRPGEHKSTAFIEDMAVPVENLANFVEEVERIMANYGVSGEIYGHASAGCLHIRPILNLKDAKDISTLRSLAQDAVTLVMRLGGSVSGEHGDGLSRSEWLSWMYDSEIIDAFHALKNAADPNGIMNPGKILDPPPMDINLRYGVSYLSQGWKTVFDLSSHGGLTGAIEQCNGAGVCRKLDGIMCPSFQATKDELHSTRGRANLLRELVSGKFPSAEMAEDVVHLALDLCVACKGCKAECPSGVDIAKLKYEFSQHYYTSHRRPLRDYIFGYIDTLSKIAHPLSVLLNPISKNIQGRGYVEKFLGLSNARTFPQISTRTFRQQIQVNNDERDESLKTLDVEVHPGSLCLVLSDAFTEYFYPEIGLAALKVLDAVGIQYQVLPVIGSGRTLISKGFLKEAKRHAENLLDKIDEYDPEGNLPVIGFEPSEIYAFKDEYLDFFPGETRVHSLAKRSRMIDEYLIRPVKGEVPIKLIPKKESTNPIMVYLHGHCYQKAQAPDPDGYPFGVSATITMLESVGYQVSELDTGCCGMAGAFGYESEHYKVSMQIGELSLFPNVRKIVNDKDHEYHIAACGYSCRTQIMDGTGVHSHHPITLISKLLS